MTFSQRAVEAAARAIYECRNGSGCKPWSLQTKAHKEPYLNDAKAALSAALAVDGVALQGWQPIESAPRDGKPFLAWEDEERGPFKCWWYENWPSDEAYWMDHACTEPQPTHWQPLPQHPAASEGEKRK